MATMTSNFLPAISAESDFTRPDWLTSELTTGTTIAAIEFEGGVIIGADSRTTSGAYIANRVTDKLTKVTDYIYCCRSGSAADTQAVADLVNYYLNFYKMELGEEPLVKTAASVFKGVCYNNRDSLSAGILVAGWDKRLGGQVYTIPLGGMLTRLPVAIGGSGSTYLYGYVDANYKPGMSKDECLKFIANAISLAINRDGSSGGVIRLACITKDGTERFLLTGDQIPKFYKDSFYRDTISLAINRDGSSGGVIRLACITKDGTERFLLTAISLAINRDGSSGGVIRLACITKDGTERFLLTAISLAINRDGSSGGVIRLACITKDGTERFLLTGDQIPKFYEDS